MEKVISAVNFAAIAHKNQRRKNAEATPYINHPIEVMYLLSNAGVTDPDILAAAVLHDTIEDCGVTYDQICQRFGQHVADYVRECSDDKSLPKVERKRQQIEHAKVISVGAKLIKIADKLSNIGDLTHNPPKNWSNSEIGGYFAWSYAVYLQLKGCNSILDTQIEAIFATRQLLDISRNDLNLILEHYYDRIS
jgi:(p)ppGpp synthase/HD superfamily hydrolase